MLIRDAELVDGRRVDVRVQDGRIAAIDALSPRSGERVVGARGGLLLPGLHDHHIHLAATAAAFASTRCGPPEVVDAAGLAAVLRRPGTGWLRGIGYHESVAGLPDAAALDRIVAHRPLRIQHRSGRMWLFNGAALEELLARSLPPPGLEHAGGRFTGRLFDEDRWLRDTLGAAPPLLDAVGAALAAHGVTGVTEMSPANDAATAAWLAGEQASGRLPQRVLLAGSLALGDAATTPTIRLGPAKLHLHEAALPSLDEMAAFVAAARAADRRIAVHCASEVELVYALAALAEAGSRPGDRIEHASLAPDALVAEIARLGLCVVTQPHFIAERGDAYRADVEARSQPDLYRLRAFLAAGVPLAAGSDAPYGGIDPWAAMAAAVSRTTGSGAAIGAGEALSPEEARDLYLRDPASLGVTRGILTGAAADLCLLDRPWAAARGDLASVTVRATWVAGHLVHDGVDQAPRQRDLRRDPPA